MELYTAFQSVGFLDSYAIGLASGAVILLLVHAQVLILIYNLWFHPLCKFPGPFLGRISGVWARFQNFYGRKAQKIHEAHLRYGNVNLRRSKSH